MRLAYLLVLVSLSACGGSGGSPGGGLVSQDGFSAGSGASPTGETTANSPPTITGSPPGDVMIGNLFEYVPIAGDVDGDALEFSIVNKPPWATFNGETGMLQGIPNAEHVGHYSGITIIVTDGVHTAGLGPFSVTVHETGLGAVTLNWQPPSHNTDGSPVGPLSGYRIYYGTRSDSYDHVISLNNPGLVRYVVENLLPGTYYFAATAVNTSGIESDKSAELVGFVP